MFNYFLKFHKHLEWDWKTETHSERERERETERSYIFHCINSSSLLIHGSLGNVLGFVENIFSFLSRFGCFALLRRMWLQSSPSRLISSYNTNYNYTANCVSYNLNNFLQRKRIVHDNSESHKLVGTQRILRIRHRPRFRDSYYRSIDRTNPIRIVE